MDPAGDLDLVADLGGCRRTTWSAPQPRRRAAVVAAEAVDAAVAHLADRGIPTWVMGEIHAAEDAPVEDGVEVVRGAKGVDGGSVQVVGSHPDPARELWGSSVAWGPQHHSPQRPWRVRRW